VKCETIKSIAGLANFLITGLRLVYKIVQKLANSVMQTLINTYNSDESLFISWRKHLTPDLRSSNHKSYSAFAAHRRDACTHICGSKQVASYVCHRLPSVQKFCSLESTNRTLMVQKQLPYGVDNSYNFRRISEPLFIRSQYGDTDSKWVYFKSSRLTYS